MSLRVVTAAEFFNSQTNAIVTRYDDQHATDMRQYN